MRRRCQGPCHSSPAVRPTLLEPSRAPRLLAIPVMSTPPPSLPAALAMAADLVTPLSTAAARLAYQLHCVIDCQSNSHPTFYSPSGVADHFLSHCNPPPPPALPTTPHHTPPATPWNSFVLALSGEYVLSLRVWTQCTM